MDDQEKNFQSGAVIDTRSDAEKAKDYRFEEVVASADPVNWVEKNPDQWRRFPIFNQDGSGSCVAQTEAKELGIMRFLIDGVYVHFSATDIYQQRSNKPEGGMGAVDARAIAAKGATLEVLSPSQSMNDAQMDGEVVEPYKHAVGAVFAVPNYIALPAGDIETIASTIQRTGKGCMVWFYFEYREWTDHPVVMNPALELSAPATCRHSVTAVDFCLVNGQKCLIIEDSWGPNFGHGGQRAIDEAFLKARNWYAGNLVSFKFQDQTQPQPVPPTKPHYVFNTDLVFNQSTNPIADVKALQDILRYEGFFPTNVQSSGFFGAITLSGVQKFQLKYAIAPAGSPGYGRVGPHTRAKLNSLYGA
jgi:hypothetical protein